MNESEIQKRLTGYRPSFDVTVRTTTIVQQHNTMHVNYIDWDSYPFDDPEHTAGRCCSDEQKREEIEKRKEWLRACEQWREKKVFASNYGGWPKIWNRVLGVGMGSLWPYWSPRPVVIIDGTLGPEWCEWMSLTGVEVRDAEGKS